MIGRTNTGGGGVGGLNFQVIGGTTAPNNPKENTIWVNTSTKITGWVFSATQPTRATGMVWISVGASSPVAFNALKKNNITVYPLSAKQYVSGKWVSKEAKSYQNGEWVEWRTYLFNESSGQVVPFTSAKEGNGSVSIGANSIELDYSSTSMGQVVVRTSHKVNLTQHNKLVLDAVCTKTQENNTYTQAALLVNDVEPAIDDQYTKYAAYALIPADNIRKHYEINVSSFSGEYYVGVKGLIGCTIYNIWLE